MLTGHAFNAMLKTLEEPPEYLKFVLATTDPAEGAGHGAVALPAVQPAADGAADGAASTWRACCGPKAWRTTPASLRLLSRAARGSMRDALSLTDQAIAFGGGALRGSRRCAQMLGSVDRGHAVRLRRGAGGARRRARCWPASTRCASSACRPPARSRRWRALLQQMAVLQAVPGALDADDPDTPRPRGWPRCCRPTRRSCSTASRCTAAPSCGWRPTSTRR